PGDGRRSGLGKPVTGRDPSGPVEATFEQTTARRRVEAVPLAQVSVELGHLYQADYLAGPDRFQELFAAVAPWARAAIQGERSRGRRPPRISTCSRGPAFSPEPPPPGGVIPPLLEAAQRAGLTIDYLARESACALAGAVSPATIVEGCLVSDPVPGTNGAR